ncbi:hypothetical protein [Paenibacillus sp. SI8]|uniref:hypothetical protein n=1 Tax=unclassified Paenibacillus TaxID=185978 RepID=UPI003465281C
MDFLLFMVFSVMETSAMYYFMFRLFKMDIIPVSIFFASTVASVISFSLREIYYYPTLDIILQLLLTFLFLWQLCKVQMFYSALVSITGFVAVAAIQTGLFYIVHMIGFFQNPPEPNSTDTHILQLVSASIVILISVFIRKRRLGFTFVPLSNYQAFQFTASNRKAVFIYISSLFPICLVYFFLDKHTSRLFFIIPMSLGFILVALLSWANKREFSDD